MRGPAADVDSTIHFLEQWFLQRKNMDLEDGWTLPVLQSSIALWLHTSTTIVRDKELTFRQLAVLFHCFAGHLGEVLLLPDSRREYSDATQPHRASVSDRRPERIILALVAKRLRSFFGEVQGLTSAFRLRYRRGQNILLSALTLWGIVLQFDDEMDLHEDQKPVSNPIVNLYSALLVQTARRVAARNDELNIQDLAHSLNYVTMPEFMRHTWSIEVVSALYDLLQALIAIRDGVRHVYLSWTADTARFAFNVLCQHYFRHGSTARDLEQRRNALIHRLWNVPRIRPSELIRDGGFLDVAPEDGILNTLQLRSPGLDDDSSPIDDAASWTSYESHNTKKVSLWRILCLGSDTSRDPRLLRIATDLVIQLRPLTHRGYKVTDVRDMLHEVMNDTILRLYSLEVSSGELRRHILLLDKNEWTALERRLDTIRTNTPQSALLLPPSSMRTTPLRLPRSGDESPKVHSDAPSGDAHALLPSAAFVRADVLPYVNAASTSTPRTTQVSFADL
ncbi:hypothetical protein BKA62DRAFT_830606 [Auriculariales sp. MPI-PUGE-AT-0066]|nr:hypothetical protein BKA62DRAFT_830606 [Auriculariales sp. MPI-PUGE-AT-0066]